MSQGEIAIEIESQPFVFNCVIDASCVFRKHIAQLKHVLGIDHLLTCCGKGGTWPVDPFIITDRLTSGHSLAILSSVPLGQSVIVSVVRIFLTCNDMVNNITIDSAKRLSHSDSSEFFSSLSHRVPSYSPSVLPVQILVLVGIIQRKHLVLVERPCDVGSPVEILPFNVYSVKGKLKTIEACTANVGHHGVKGTCVRKSDIEQHVPCTFVIVVSRHSDPVIQEVDIKAQIQLRSTLPSQILILH